MENPAVSSVYVALEDEHLKAIGLVCHQWAALQGVFEHLIWSAAGLDQTTGRLVTTQVNDLSRIDIARSLVGTLADSLRDEALDMVKEYNELRMERNKVVHNTWAGERNPLATGFKPTAKGEFKHNRSHWSADDITHLAEDIEALCVRLVNFVSLRLGWPASKKK